MQKLALSGALLLAVLVALATFFVSTKQQQSQPKTLECTTRDGHEYVQWSCPPGTTVSVGSRDGGTFNTHGAVSGALEQPRLGAVYTLECFSGHSLVKAASCSATHSTSVGQTSNVVE